MHGAEARARFPRRCSETRKMHAPNTLFFRRKNMDFMIFRNGYKLVFNMLHPGKIQITFHHMSSPFLTSNSSNSNPAVIPDGTIEAAWGAFNEIRWVSDKKPVNPDHLVKYYLRTFVQNSTK